MTTAITRAGFKQIPNIIKAPDHAIIGARRKGTLINAYAKKTADTTYLYFEEVLRGRKNKSLRGKTLFKVNKPLTLERFIKIVTLNYKTDISGAKKI